MARQPQLYLDNNATTPLRPDAVSAMQLAMGPPSNPSSVHGYGRAARMIVEEARAEIAMLAGCRGADLVFTSGGTEANNLALSMFDTIITSAVEHDSVMQAAPDAKRIPVDSEGRVDLAALGEMLDSLDDAARPRTLVSVMTANNETGVIQPVDEIVALAKSAGVAVHSDMVQALGKQHLDFAGSGLDFASLSAHKIGGPAGVGALLVRPGRAMTSLLRGGGQEQGRRSGTENVIGIAGFGGAAKPHLTISPIIGPWPHGVTGWRRGWPRSAMMPCCSGPGQTVSAIHPALPLASAVPRRWSWRSIWPAWLSVPVPHALLARFTRAMS